MYYVSIMEQRMPLARLFGHHHNPQGINLSLAMIYPFWLHIKTEVGVRPKTY